MTDVASAIMDDAPRRVQTVLGAVDPETIGYTLMHEHVFLDASCLFEPVPGAADLREAAVTAGSRADVVFYPFSCLDNLRLEDAKVAAFELDLFRRAGGAVLVDLTPSHALGRDPEGLARVSLVTGLHIVMGTGHYQERCTDPLVRHATESALEDAIVRDVMDGVDGTGIRSGIIGEIGCSGQTEQELKVLRAASRAQKITGAALNIHQTYEPGERAAPHRLLDTVAAAGGDLTRTILSHMDESGADVELQEELLARGAVIEYDVCGYENAIWDWSHAPVTDATRARDVYRLVQRGWIEQILLSQDVCFKTMLVTYGGWGYAHILERFVPGLRWVGLGDDEIHRILVENPRRLLAMRS